MVRSILEIEKSISSFLSTGYLRYFSENKLFRFLLVGGVNTVFGYLMFALFVFVGFHYAVAVLLGTILGIIFNFNTTGRLVFNCSDKLLIYKFIGVYVIIYLINTISLRIFNIYNFDMYSAGAFLLFPMALLSFILNKTFVFKGGT